MKFASLSVAAAAVVCALTLAACETPTDEAIESARACTNQAAKLALTSNPAAPAAAQACEQIIINAGTTTPEALKIQFGAILIEDQILANIAQVASAQKNNSGSLDSIDTMVSYLVPVPISGTADAESTRINTVASGTGDSSIVYVASLIQMAVALNDLAALNPTTPAQAQTDLNNCASNPTCTNEVATAFTTLAASACASPYDQTSTSPTDACYMTKQIQDAAGPNPTPTQLVTALAAYAGTSQH